MKSICLAASLLICSTAFGQGLVTKADKDELVFMRDQEPAMRQAFDKAGATLSEFLATANAASPQHTNFALKVAISQGGNTEYFWVGDFAEKADGSFEGKIDNEPRMVKTVKLGQRYAFPRARIVDWTYIDKTERRMLGNFTLCALLTKEPKAEADAMKKKFKLDCEWLKP